MGCPLFRATGFQDPVGHEYEVLNKRQILGMQMWWEAQRIREVYNA